MRTVKKEILSLFKSKHFYLTIIIIVISGFITLLKNSNLYMLNDYKPIGAINLFIYSNIKGNIITSIFSPIIITLPVLTIMYKRKNSNRISGKYLYKEIFSLSILSMVVVLFAYILSYIFCIMLSPHASSALPIVNYGLFAEIYNKSLFLYTLIHIIHSIVCGISFSLMAYSLYCLSGDFFFALTIPNAYYYLSLSFKGILSGKLLQISIYMLPTLFYNFDHTGKVGVNLAQIINMYLLSFVLFLVFHIKKTRKFNYTKEHNKND